MEKNERLEAAIKCAERYTDEKEKRIARSAFMSGCEFEAQGEIVKGIVLEQPVCEGFSKEFDDYFLPKNREQKGRWGFADIFSLARHFAKWGAEHLADARKTSPKYLEEAAKECNPNLQLQEYFIKGGMWQREQMMKEAVEGWVAADSDTTGERRVTLFPKKPVRDVLTEYKYWAATRPRYESIKLDSNAFPNLKWEDEPKKVRIIFVEED